MLELFSLKKGREHAGIKPKKRRDNPHQETWTKGHKDHHSPHRQQK
jgi:hypothetical protein